MSESDAEQEIFLKSNGREPINSSSASLAILTSILWGGTAVSISFSVDTLPPAAVSGIRFAMGTVFMYFWCRTRGSSISIKPSELFYPILLGFFLFAQIALCTWGIQLSNSLHATVLINSFIFWTFAIEHFITRDFHLKRSQLGGLVVAGMGILILLITAGTTEDTSKRDPATLSGDLILLLSGMLLGVKIVLTKKAVMQMNPDKVIFWHDVFGVILLAAWSLCFETVELKAFNTPAVLGLLYQGIVVAGFCFAMNAVLLTRHSASQLSAFNFLTPLCGIVLSILIRGDALSIWIFLSAVCIIFGIVSVTRSK